MRSGRGAAATVLAAVVSRAWGSRAGGAMLPRLISVVPVGGNDLPFFVLLSKL